MAAMVAMGAFAFSRLGAIEQQATVVETQALSALYYSTEIYIKWQQNYSLTRNLVLASTTATVEKTQLEIQKNWPSWMR